MNISKVNIATPSTPGCDVAGGWRIGPLRGLAVIGQVLTLTACGTYGEPLVLSRYYDSRDPCQSQNYKTSPPSFCGAGSGRTVIYSTPTGNPIGAAVGYTKKN